jgi:SAM-dependent methyltransferase
MGAAAHSYDDFYQSGGWKYNLRKVRALLTRTIIKPLRLPRGARVLEIGCGQGYHSRTLHDLGFQVTGNDISQRAISFALEQFHGPAWLCADTAELPRRLPAESFNVIFAHGHSWYHYELGGVNRGGVDVPARTRELFGLLAPGGLFVLQIKTDFSGARPPDSVHHNRLADYLGLFRPLGEVVLVSDWAGKSLRNEQDAVASGNNIIIATRKPAAVPPGVARGPGG